MRTALGTKVLASVARFFVAPAKHNPHARLHAQRDSVVFLVIVCRCMCRRYETQQHTYLGVDYRSTFATGHVICS